MGGQKRGMRACVAVRFCDAIECRSWDEALHLATTHLKFIRAATWRAPQVRSGAQPIAGGMVLRALYRLCEASPLLEEDEENREGLVGSAFARVAAFLLDDLGGWTALDHARRGVYDGLTPLATAILSRNARAIRALFRHPSRQWDPSRIGSSTNDLRDVSPLDLALTVQHDGVLETLLNNEIAFGRLSLGADDLSPLRLVFHFDQGMQNRAAAIVAFILPGVSLALACLRSGNASNVRRWTDKHSMVKVASWASWAYPEEGVILPKSFTRSRELCWPAVMTLKKEIQGIELKVESPRILELLMQAAGTPPEITASERWARVAPLELAAARSRENEWTALRARLSSTPFLQSKSFKWLVRKGQEHAGFQQSLLSVTCACFPPELVRLVASYLVSLLETLVPLISLSL